MRVASTIQSPPYTVEDRALLAGLAMYESGLCPGCKQPTAIAWHSEMDGWYDDGVDKFVCHACTARADGDKKKATYVLARHTRDLHKDPLPPFVLGVTTTDS